MFRHALLVATALAGLACLPEVASAQPVTGLYVGAGAGVNFLQTEPTELLRTSPSATIGNRDVRYDQPGGAGVISLGYGFGNGFRVELEGNIRYDRVRQVSGTPYPTNAGGDHFTYGAMVNGLFDLDIRSPYVFPYLGVGAGYAWSEYDNFHTYGTNYPYSIRASGTQGNFAYEGIIGASFPIPPVVGLSLTAEYRFFSTVGDRNYSYAGVNGPLRVAGTLRQSDPYNHSILLGVRYAFHVTPPPPPPSQPAPAPVAEPARTYLVFFDWDRADLTARARQIIGEAAQASTRVQVTRIEVNGYTDLSGTARYNQGLSVRRANAVAAELVRDGVPRNEIVARGFGESNPLVPTAQGVREPQNRRVEIILR